MAKLTKAEAKKHHEAEQLLNKPAWTHADREFFTQHWQESANHVNTTAGAFFTPLDYAMDVALDIGPGKVLDLCAGIGTLSYAAQLRNGHENVHITCIELNPAYVEIGRKMVPEARWICGNVFEELPKLGTFDYAISNPPFGNIKHEGRGPRYKGSKFEYQLIDLAAEHATRGITLILPQASAGFKYSGHHNGYLYGYQRQENPEYKKFEQQTGIYLDAGIGIDSSAYNDWHGVTVQTEVATANTDNLIPAQQELAA